MDREPILTVKNLKISFHTKAGMLQAIRGIDFDLERGKTLAIVGESGSGKSVTVRAIMGIRSKNEDAGGSILYRCRQEDGSVKEYDIIEMKKKDVISQLCGKHIAMVFQDPMTTLDPTMTIGKQVMEGMRLHLHITKDEAWKRAVALLDEVGITSPETRMKQYPHQLSGGMRQRVVIAIALSCEPDILICDEPTTALDVTIQAKILELIARIQREREISVIYITHDLGVVAKVADSVAVMYAGHIVEQGTAREIFYEPRHPYTWGLLDSVPDISKDTERLYSIPGNPPNLLSQVKGDAFAPRNQYALAIDYEEEPPRFQISDTHYVYSWLEDPRAPKISRAAGK
ncbi:MAG: ABC transporter ATP-binding protein [Lachnospiraceae bacterium]|nr:ABC transporter ATP-binding protein [Lachnospiraceae bacterium]